MNNSANPADNVAATTVAAMLENDAFSRWLGLEVVALETDRVTLRMPVRADMLNGFDVCHGGITFSLADSALAFASNSRGRQAMSIENSMAYPAKAVVGDILTAVAEPQAVGNKIGTYHVTVSKQDGTVVGIFRGTVFRTSRSVVEKAAQG